MYLYHDTSELWRREEISVILLSVAISVSLGMEERFTFIKIVKSQWLASFHLLKYSISCSYSAHR